MTPEGLNGVRNARLILASCVGNRHVNGGGVGDELFVQGQRIGAGRSAADLKHARDPRCELSQDRQALAHQCALVTGKARHIATRPREATRIGFGICIA